MNDTRAEKVIEYLNRYTCRHYRARHKDGSLTRNALLALERINDGYTGKDFAIVIRWKSEQWLHDEKMEKYLRPSTLFRPGNFEAYLVQAKSEFRSLNTHEQMT